jgi:hypothetical protein
MQIDEEVMSKFYYTGYTAEMELAERKAAFMNKGMPNKKQEETILPGLGPSGLSRDRSSNVQLPGPLEGTTTVDEERTHGF